MANRIMLTKAELLLPAGRELVALCTSITEDGIVSDEEIGQLRTWVHEHQGAPVEAISFFSSLLGQRGGSPTDELRREVHRGIERVLPKDIRDQAIARRKEVEARLWAEHEKNPRNQSDEWRRARRAGETDRRAALVTASGVCDLTCFDFPIAGSMRRQDIIRRHAVEGDCVQLVRDLANACSPNAIEVRSSHGVMLGYVPEPAAVKMAPFLDRGCGYDAKLTRVLQRDYGLVPLLEIDIDTARPAAVIVHSSAATPAAAGTREAASRSPLLALILVLAAILFVGIVAAIVARTP